MFIQIDDIADRLEDEERNPDGQKDIMKRQPVPSRQVIKYPYKKIGILKIAQNSEIDRHTEYNPPFSCSLSLSS